MTSIEEKAAKILDLDNLKMEVDSYDFGRLTFGNGCLILPVPPVSAENQHDSFERVICKRVGKRISVNRDSWMVTTSYHRSMPIVLSKTKKDFVTFPYEPSESQWQAFCDDISFSNPVSVFDFYKSVLPEITFAGKVFRRFEMIDGQMVLESGLTPEIEEIEEHYNAPQK